MKVLTFDRSGPRPPGRPALFERLLRRLERLDAEQLQVVEIVVAAISRGALQ